MKKRVHRSSLRKIGRRSDMPCVGWEMDWVYFCSTFSGTWKWGNPRRLYGVKTEQERRADEDEKEQRKEVGLQ